VDHVHSARGLGDERGLGDHAVFPSLERAYGLRYWSIRA
jgi:hypothetical protein